MFREEFPYIIPDDIVARYLSSVHPGKHWQCLGGISWLSLSKFEVLTDSSTRRISMASVDNILCLRFGLMELQWVIKKCENSAGVLKTDLLFRIFFTWLRIPVLLFLHITWWIVLSVLLCWLCSLEIYVRGGMKVLPHFYRHNNFNHNEIYVYLWRILHGV